MIPNSYTRTGNFLHPWNFEKRTIEKIAGISTRLIDVCGESRSSGEQAVFAGSLLPG